MIQRRIIVVGSVNMDLMLRCPHLPAAGETVLGTDFITAPGGKGANQAIAAARLGALVSFVGCMGDDEYGTIARAALEADGVDTRHLVRVSGAATGVAMVIADSAGENCIALAPGANHLLSPAHIDAADALFADAALLVCQLESPLATVRYAMATAARHGVPVLLNPAPSQVLPIDMLQGIDLLVANAGEAAVLTGYMASNVEEATHAGSVLRLAGVQTAMVTLGGQGVVLASAESNAHFPAVKVHAVDTTGAGDTFVGALATARVRGFSLSASIDFAQQAAAFSVTRRGARAGMPRLTALTRLAAPKERHHEENWPAEQRAV